LFYLVLAGDFDPSIRGELPAAVRAALDGDPTPLLRLADSEPAPLALRTGLRGEDTEFSNALFLATTCAETALPWPPGASPAAKRAAATAFVASRPASEFFPFDRATARTSQPLAVFAGRVVPGRCDGPRPFAPEPPLPASFAAVVPAPGTSGDPGRALAAAGMAIADALRESRRFDLYGERMSRAEVLLGGLRSGR